MSYSAKSFASSETTTHYKGAYSTTAAYAPNDIVVYNGLTYVCKTNIAAGGTTSAPAYVGTTVQHGRGTTINPALPAGTQVGDLVVLIITSYNQNTTVNTAGFTQATLAQGTGSNYPVRTQVLTQIATQALINSGVSVNYSDTFTVTLRVYRNATATLNTSASYQSSTDQTSQNFPAITTTTPYCLIVYAGGSLSTNQTYTTTGTGGSNPSTNNSGDYANTYTADGVLAAAGANPTTVTYATNVSTTMALTTLAFVPTGVPPNTFNVAQWDLIGGGTSGGGTSGGGGSGTPVTLTRSPRAIVIDDCATATLPTAIAGVAATTPATITFDSTRLARLLTGVATYRTPNFAFNESVSIEVLAQRLSTVAAGALYVSLIRVSDGANLGYLALQSDGNNVLYATASNGSGGGDFQNARYKINLNYNGSSIDYAVRRGYGFNDVVPTAISQSNYASTAVTDGQLVYAQIQTDGTAQFAVHGVRIFNGPITYGTDTVSGVGSVVTQVPLFPTLAQLAYLEVTGGSASPGASFTTVIDGTVVLDSANAYNPTTGIYTVPVSGTYQCNAQIRVLDGGSLDVGLGIGTSNIDAPWFRWQSTPAAATGSNRNTVPYTRIAHFNAGDQLRLYTYFDGTGTISGSAMQIRLVTPDTSPTTAVAGGGGNWSYQGAWDSTKTYAVNDVVTRTYALYVALLAVPANNDPTTPPGGFTVGAAIGATGPSTTPVMGALGNPCSYQPFTTGATGGTVAAVSFGIASPNGTDSFTVGIASAPGATPATATYLQKSATFTPPAAAGVTQETVTLPAPVTLAPNTTYYVVFDRVAGNGGIGIEYSNVFADSGIIASHTVGYSCAGSTTGWGTFTGTNYIPIQLNVAAPVTPTYWQQIAFPLAVAATERLGTATTVAAADWQTNGSASISAGVGTATNGTSQGGNLISKATIAMVDGTLLRADVKGGGAAGTGSADFWTFGLIDAAQAATVTNGRGEGLDGLFLQAQTYQTYMVNLIVRSNGVAYTFPNSGGLFSDPNLWKQQQIEVRYFKARRTGYWDVEYVRDGLVICKWTVPYTAPATSRIILGSVTGGTQGTVTIANPSVLTP